MEITTDLDIPKKRWDATRQRVTGDNSTYSNDHLDKILVAIRNCEKDTDGEGLQKLRYIRDRLLGKDQVSLTYDLTWLLSNFFEVKLSDGNDLEKSTRDSVKRKMAIIQSYISFQDWGEMRVTDFKPIHARKCYQWIREKGYSHNTAVKACQAFKEAFRYAIEDGVIYGNPFARLKLTEVAAELEFLEKADLDKLHNHPFAKEELRHSVDLFLLMCYTGMNISDLAKLNPDHFYQEGGRTWLKYIRKKSARNKPALIGNIPIFPEVTRLLEKHGNRLKIHTGQAINRQLKMAEDELKIPVHLTTKLGRKTCGHMLVNEMGLSVDVASAILGNSIRTFLKNYANVRQQRIAMELDKLA